MAFGFKIKKLVTKESYTLEELFEKIKDHQFTAGVPSLSKHGLTQVITFPPLDSNNQIWITQSQLGKGPYTKWQIFKNEQVGLDSAVINAVGEKLTGGLSRLSSIFGSKAKKIEELIVATAKELEEMGL